MDPALKSPAADWKSHSSSGEQDPGVFPKKTPAQLIACGHAQRIFNQFSTNATNFLERLGLSSWLYISTIPCCWSRSPICPSPKHICWRDRRTRPHFCRSRVWGLVRSVRVGLVPPNKANGDFRSFSIRPPMSSTDPANHNYARPTVKRGGHQSFLCSAEVIPSPRPCTNLRCRAQEGSRMAQPPPKVACP